MRADDRLLLRLATDEKATLTEAATAAGVSVSRFVRGAALDQAATVLGERRGYTRLAPDAYDEMVAALDAPAQAPPALMDWLRHHAFRQTEEHCFVWRGHDDVDVSAYYTLTGHRILRTGSPGASPAGLPALLLRRLCVASLDYRRGVGGALLVDALRRAVATAHVDGSVYVVAEPHNDHGIGFLRHHGFWPVPGTDRLAQRISDIADALGHTWQPEEPLTPPRGRHNCARTENGLHLM